MTCTSIHVTAETREIPPTSGGWRQMGPTGVVSFTCSCGAAVRGSRDKVEALAEPHMRAVASNA